MARQAWNGWRKLIRIVGKVVIKRDKVRVPISLETIESLGGEVSHLQQAFWYGGEYEYQAEVELRGFVKALLASLGKRFFL
jgi:hypothetical protein